MFLCLVLDNLTDLTLDFIRVYHRDLKNVGRSRDSKIYPKENENWILDKWLLVIVSGTSAMMIALTVWFVCYDGCQKFP